jgi:uncharacterized protein (TIGR03067 family)
MRQSGQVSVPLLVVLVPLLAGCADFTVVSVSTPVLPPADDIPAEDDWQKMQGTWRVLRWETGDTDPLWGDEAFRETLEKIHWDIGGDTMTRYLRHDYADSSLTMTFELERDCNPKAITIRGDGSSTPGIYELQGNILRICLATRGHDRPGAFHAEFGKSELLVMKRYAPNTCERVLDPIRWQIIDWWNAATMPFVSAWDDLTGKNAINIHVRLDRGAESENASEDPR